MREVTDLDRQSFQTGRHSNLHKLLGAHPEAGGVAFRVWAPHARTVRVIGEFDGWGAASSSLVRDEDGLWSGFVSAARVGQLYKYRIVGLDGATQDKADPFAVATEAPPGTASRVADLDYAWADDAWLRGRHARQSPEAPISIYEVHLGSWRGEPGDATYRTIASPLADHVAQLGFTHVELLPIMEHPFYGSWGYQTTGYFAPTSRYGSPQDLMYLVDTLHARGIGVIFDWTPAHFADDPHGLGHFDGAPLFEQSDPRRRRHPEWGTLVFAYDRPEVRSFLISSACSWLERYHGDGLRVDAVSSMLYRDFSRKPGEWVPNRDGGHEDASAVGMLRDLNEVIHERFPDVLIAAEEATDWPGVTHPASEGGLGFDLKWDTGWAADTLVYLRRAPRERPDHHRELTFRSLYANTEHYLLPLSHDQSSPEAGALLAQMPGDEAQRLAGLRALLGYQFALAAKKLLFMGTELAPPAAWDHERALDWSQAAAPVGAAMAHWIAALNRAYREVDALHAGDALAGGFEWVSGDDAALSVLAFERRGAGATVLVIANFAGEAHPAYRVGVASPGPWRVLLDSDAAEFGGSRSATVAPRAPQAIPWHGRAYSLELELPPLSIVFLIPGQDV